MASRRIEMPDSQSSDRANAPVGSPPSEVTAPASPQDGDAGLLTLEEQFDELVRELLAAHPTGIELATCLHQPSLRHDVEPVDIDADTGMKQAEAILARLYPIEQAIMQTRARTIAGLGVKARHAAYVMSQYWEEPIDKIDWEAQAIRQLIEAVCDFARTALPFRSETSDG
jgi:hypothetical protein